MYFLFQFKAMAVLKILVLLYFSMSVFGKSVKLQFDFEDILKLLPYVGNSNNLRQIVSSLSRSANVRAEPTRGRYNNPYHPEDDIPDPAETLLTDVETNKEVVIKDIFNENSKIVDGLSKARQIKAQTRHKVDLDMEKDNDNFIKDKQSISEDELTDFVNDVNSLSASVQKLTKESGNTYKVFESTSTTPAYTVNVTENANNQQQNTNDDRSGFQFLQKRFVLKSSDPSSTSKTVEATQDALQSQGIQISENAPETQLKVSTQDDFILKTKNDDLENQDKKYNDHVAKRDLSAKWEKIVQDDGKYVGFVIRPETKVTRSYKNFDDPAEQDMKSADNVAIKALQKSDDSAIQTSENINAPSDIMMNTEKKKDDNPANDIPINAAL